MQSLKLNFSVLLIFAMMSGCYSSNKFQLSKGDLLFQGDASGSGLSGAISDVTQTDKKTRFAHVGIVTEADGEVLVLHADPVDGVCIEPLDSFMVDKDGARRPTEAYRLKKPFRKGIDQAIERGKTMIGKPYNFSYIVEDPGYYCSELIWWAFKPDSVFSLNPMNFKDEKTGEYHPRWVDYYDDLGMDIPQGEPGCNPNGMAASEKLINLGVVD